MGSLLRVWQRRTPRAMAPHALWLLLLTVPLVVHAEQLTGTIVGISAGDTLRVLRQGKAVTVHLYGVVCPARRHAVGAQARQFTRDVAFQQVVAVLVDSPTSRSRRLIAGVQLPDGRDLSQALVQAGYAWPESRYAPADRRLARLEAEARAAKRGLWAQPSPRPFWQSRTAQQGPLLRVQAQPLLRHQERPMACGTGSLACRQRRCLALSRHVWHTPLATGTRPGLLLTSGVLLWHQSVCLSWTLG